MIIEMNEKEYMEEMNRMYEEEVKPLLNKGFSLTKTFKKLGVATGKHSRKSKELRKLALDDGYKLRNRRK